MELLPPFLPLTTGSFRLARVQVGRPQFHRSERLIECGGVSAGSRRQLHRLVRPRKGATVGTAQRSELRQRSPPAIRGGSSGRPLADRKRLRWMPTQRPPEPVPAVDHASGPITKLELPNGSWS